MRSLEVKSCAACALGRVATPGECPFHDLRKPAGTVLLEQGEVPQHVWFVREGTVLLTSVNAAGDETSCALRGPQSILGLEALRGDPVDYQAWSLSEVVVCTIDKPALEAWMGNRDTPMGAILGLALDEGAKRRDERVALAGRAVTRVARFLLERRQIEGDDRPLHVEHQVLARMLGMRAETLSRALATLRSSGAIGEGRHVEVANPEELARHAGEG